VLAVGTGQVQSVCMCELRRCHASCCAVLSQGLMSLLDHDLYGDPDEFREQYGSDTPTLEQIRALQVRPPPQQQRQCKLSDTANLVHSLQQACLVAAAAHTALPVCCVLVCRAGCAGPCAAASHEGGCGGPA
jgi:hypothetical protein